jgi:hypothetical protein
MKNITNASNGVGVFGKNIFLAAKPRSQRHATKALASNRPNICTLASHYLVTLLPHIFGLFAGARLARAHLTIQRAKWVPPGPYYHVLWHGAAFDSP